MGGFDWGSALIGGAATIILVVIGLIVIVSLLLGKVKDQLRIVLGKIFTRTSLMLIAIADVVAAFEPSQIVAGLVVAPIAGVVIFLNEWGLHDKFKTKRLAPGLIIGLIAGVIVAIPLPIAGLFVAWFGLRGKKQPTDR